jgi:UPF0271 protein
VVLDAAADLEYDDDGKNIIEPVPEAKDPGVVADRALGLACGHVVTVSGRTVPLAVETVCVHGDRPNAVAVAVAVRHRLEAAGFEVRSAFGVVGP